MTTSRETIVRRFDQRIWAIEGVLSARTLDAAAPTADGGPGKFGPMLYVPVNLLVGDFRIVRAVPGTSGTTTVDIYRLRASVWTLVATLTITGTVAMTTNVVSMDPFAAITTWLAGDIIMARLRTIEAGPAAGLTVTAELR